jgi:uncharacterized protein GlcG (DUF336 family)
MSLDLETARSMIAATRAAGHELGLQPLTVVVLDPGGHVIAAEREDGASMGRFQIAHGKAHGALAMGLGSRALLARAQQQPFFVAAAGAALGGALVPVPGGVLIRDEESTLLGAIGVSGDSSDNDERVALTGVEAVRLTAEPG